MNFNNELKNLSKSLIDSLLRTPSISDKIDDKLRSLIYSEIEHMFINKIDSSESIIVNKSCSSPIETIKTAETIQKKTMSIDKSTKTVDCELSYNKNKCLCRIWNTGLGTQCTRDKKKDDFCNNHYKKYMDGKLEFGIVSEPRPTIYTEFTKGKKTGTVIKWKIDKPLDEGNSANIVDKPINIQPVDKKPISNSSDIIEPSLIPTSKQETKNECFDDNQDPNFGINEEHETDNLIIKSEYNKLGLDKNTLDMDDTDFDVDDELILDGVKYNQFKYDESIIYILDDDDKKIAEWDGIDKETIIWVSTEDEEKHKQLSEK